MLAFNSVDVRQSKSRKQAEKTKIVAARQTQKAH